MMRATTMLLLALCVFAGPGAAQSRTSKTLDIYVVDVEGGNATLLVSPSGQSLLIDTGNGGAAAARDADRIMAAVKDAGLSVTIMNNGARKGGQPDAMKILLSSPRLQNLWQIHFSFLGGQEHTVPGMFIANIEETAIPVAPMTPPQPGTPAPPALQHNGTAYWIKVSAQMDGAFTVSNGRNGVSKTYPAVSGTN